MDNNGSDKSMNSQNCTTIANELQEEPIKISIYTSDDGQYHMKYDDYTMTGGVNAPKSNRKSNSNKAPSIVKPTTETLYEIDLYCDVCNHDYKSLMSLNRHMRTRKHLNQLAKMNEANEKRVVERDWTNYESYLSTYDLMSSDVYNSIVRTLLDDGSDAIDANAMVTDTTNTLNEQYNVSDSSNFQNTYDSHENYHNHYATTNNDIFHEIHKAMDVIANNDQTNDENKAVFDIKQCHSDKCLVCGELFASVQQLQEHTQRMRENCAAQIVAEADDFDLDAELQNLQSL